MSRAYEQRLSVPLAGLPDVRLFTRSGTHVATGYDRIVVGDRGPYVEFNDEQLVREALRESGASHYYYVELRTVPDDVKVYVQVHRVDYADYVPGKCYVSPFDLYDDAGQALIKPLRGS